MFLKSTSSGSKRERALKAREKAADELGAAHAEKRRLRSLFDSVTAEASEGFLDQRLLKEKRAFQTKLANALTRNAARCRELEARVSQAERAVVESQMSTRQRKEFRGLVSGARGKRRGSRAPGSSVLYDDGDWGDSCASSAAAAAAAVGFGSDQKPRGSSRRRFDRSGSTNSSTGTNSKNGGGGGGGSSSRSRSSRSASQTGRAACLSNPFAPAASSPAILPLKRPSTLRGSPSSPPPPPARRWPSAPRSEPSAPPLPHSSPSAAAAAAAVAAAAVVAGEVPPAPAPLKLAVAQIGVVTSAEEYDSLPVAVRVREGQ